MSSLLVDGGVQLADGILQSAHALIGRRVLLAQRILQLCGALCRLLCQRAGLVGHPVVVVNFVPVIAAPLRILRAAQLADDPETVSDGLVGILPLQLVIAGQTGVSVADGLEDFSAALCAKNIVHVRFSFLRCSRTTCFRSRMTRSPRNSH